MTETATKNSKAPLALAVLQWVVLAAALCFFLTVAAAVNTAAAWTIFTLLAATSAALVLAIGRYSLQGLRKPRWVLWASILAFVLAAGLGAMG